MALNRFLRKAMRRTVIRATETFLGRKLTRAEVRSFITEVPVVQSDNHCQRLFDCHDRGDYLLFRLGYPPEASVVCLGEISRWVHMTETALRHLAHRLGRKHLPAVLIAVPVDERGMAIAIARSEHRVDLRT